MDPEPNTFNFGLNFTFLLVLYFLSFFGSVSRAEQYYDPQTRRYVETDPQLAARPRTIRAVPTQAQIEAERQKLARQQAIQAQLEEEARNAGNKRFDPNRFHKTEDVGFY